jgi:hypothetical protein
MKIILTLLLLTTISLASFSQTVQKADSLQQKQHNKYSYAYILIKGKVFSRKLIVSVDFGDTPAQIKEGEAYSEKLTNRKSYAAILNYMVASDYELVETLDYTDQYNGAGGTSGVVFIMRKIIPQE